MPKWRFVPVLFMVVSWFFTGSGVAQSPHVLNDFESSEEGWGAWYGNISNIRAESGKLMWETDGSASAVRDGYNNTDAVFQPGAGGVDLTGLSALEFVNLMYTGDAPTINVEFYLKASVDDTFRGSDALIGHDVTFTAGIPQTVTVPLENLVPAEMAWIRIYGVTIRAATYSATWSLDEVRSLGTPLEERYFAQFTPDSPDNGFQSVFANFGLEGIQGNTGENNQDGFSIVADAGVDGALRFVSLGGALSGETPTGGAISICNGFGNLGFSGGAYTSQPTDISNYENLEWMMKADETDVADEVEGATIAIQLFVQTGTGWGTYNILGGSPFSLEADNEWHKLTGDLSAMLIPEWVYTIGINIFGHNTDMTIQIDHVRAYKDQPSGIQNWFLY